MDNKLNEYKRLLDGSGTKFKELALDRAAHDPALSLLELKELVEFAYPEPA